MRELLPFIVVGLTSGSLYGLAGVGLVLTFRTSGVFNFAHGAIGAAAAFFFYTLHVEHGVAWPLAGVVTVTVFGLVGGVVMERITRGLADAPQVLMVVVTVGVVLAIQGILYLQYGAVTRNFPPFLPTNGFHVSGVLVSWGQVIAALVALGAAVGLYAMLRFSRLGVAMRGVVDDPELIGLTGERPNRIRATAWIIGCSFAALSGCLLAPTLGLDANLLTLLVVQAFGACAIGLFSSLPLTYVGGLLVGLSAAVATKYLTERPWDGVAPAMPFLILIVMLLVLPPDKLPRSRVSLRSLVPVSAPLTRSRAVVATAAGLTGLLVLPAFVETRLPVWINGLTYVVVFGSLALLVWISGQISLCHAAFLCLGATSLSHLQDAGVPWGLAVVLAGLLTVPAGALVAVPAIRLSGMYLALATLGFGILMQAVVYQAWFMFGSTPSLSASRPQLGPLDGTSDEWFYYVVLVAAVATCALLVAVQRSQLGRLLRALAESPTMLVTHGLGVNTTRLLVFCLSAFLAGVAGALTITQFGAVSGVTYGPFTSLLLVAVLAIGGARPLRSTLVAAGLLGVLPGYIVDFDSDRQTLLFGAVAVAAGLVLAAWPRILAWIQAAAASTDDRLRDGPVRRRTLAHQAVRVGGSAT